MFSFEMILEVITLATLITLVSSRDAVTQVVFNVPNIVDQLIYVNKLLNSFSGTSEGYSNSGTLESSDEYDDSNNNDVDDKQEINNVKSDGDLNIIRMSMQGLQSILEILQSFSPSSLRKRFNSQVAMATLEDMIGINSLPSERKLDYTLSSLIEVNKKRNQLIKEFNVPLNFLTKFPGLFYSTIMRRARELRPSVEIGPGAIKTEIVTYPPNFLASRLKHLLKIKKKQKEQNIL